MSDDLIRRSDVIKTIEAEECLGYVECKTEHLINQIRTIEPIKPKRGEWIRAYRKFDQAYHNCCSLCREWNGLDVEGWNWTPNFCPNCGADMRGKDNERRLD